MSNKDGMGPVGMGPKTGRGKGNCKPVPTKKTGTTSKGRKK